MALLARNVDDGCDAESSEQSMVNNIPWVVYINSSFHVLKMCSSYVWTMVSVRLIFFPVRKSDVTCSSSSTATFAFYDRRNKTTCPEEATDTTACSVPGATDKVRAICQDKTMCDVSRSFPDLGPGSYKYLSVTYTCRKYTMV